MRIDQVVNFLRNYPMILVIIPVVTAVCIFVFYAEEKLKSLKTINRKGFVEEAESLLNQYGATEFVIKSIARKLTAIDPGFKNDNYRRATWLLIVYLTIVTIFSVSFIGIFDIWYISAITIGIVSIVPIVVFNLYIDKKEREILVQLPHAIEEVATAFRARKVLVTSVEDALPMMGSHIKKEFELLVFYLRQDTPEVGIQKFIFRIQSKWMKILGMIFLAYLRRGGDLSGQLEYLNESLTYFWLEKDKIKSKMFMPKMLIVSMLGLVPLAIYVNSQLFPISKAIYFTDSIAIGMLATALSAIIMGFLGVMIIERM